MEHAEETKKMTKQLKNKIDKLEQQIEKHQERKNSFAG